MLKRLKRAGSKLWKKVKKPAMIAGGLAAAKFGGPALLARVGGFGAGAATMGSSARAAATAIGGFASKHSGLIGAGAGLLGQRMANVGSAQQASRQMDFQERMSSTAHQRQVEDLKAAGLNPILSANAGASAPGGAMGQVGNIGEAGVSSAVNARRNKAEVDNLLEQNKLIQAQKNQTDAGTANIAQQTKWFPDIASSQMDQAHSAAQQSRQQAILYELQQGRLSLENDIWRGPMGRELLLSTMGTPATAAEVLRQGANIPIVQKLRAADKTLQGWLGRGQRGMGEFLRRPRGSNNRNTGGQMNRRGRNR